MTYNQEIIDAIAASISESIPYRVFYSENARELYDSHRVSLLMDTIGQIVKELNRSSGTHARKSVDTLRDILSERGISCESPDRHRLIATIGACRFSIVYNRGIEIAVGKASDGLLYRPLFHCTASEKDIADLLECIAAVDAKSIEKIEDRRVRAARKVMVSEVELPGVRQQVAEALGPLGINYSLENDQGENTLSVQIVNEVWMRKKVSLEDIGKDLRIVPFLIKRPDCIRLDGRGFVIFHNWDWRRR